MLSVQSELKAGRIEYDRVYLAYTFTPNMTGDWAIAGITAFYRTCATEVSVQDHTTVEVRWPMKCLEMPNAIRVRIAELQERFEALGVSVHLGRRIIKS